MCSCGLTPIGHRAAGAGLGGLVPTSPSRVLGGLAPSTADFDDFRQHGPRLPPSGLPPPSGVLNIGPWPPTTLGFPHLRPFPTDPLSSDSLRSSSGDLYALDPESAATLPATTNSRWTLDPSDVLPTRTRRRKAVVAGTPPPPVDHGFSGESPSSSSLRSPASTRPPWRPPTTPLAPSMTPVSPSLVPTANTGLPSNPSAPPAYGLDSTACCNFGRLLCCSLLQLSTLRSLPRAWFRPLTRIHLRTFPFSFPQG